MNNTPPWIARGKSSGPVPKGSSSRTNKSNYDLYNSWRWRKHSKAFRIKNNKCAKCRKEHVDYKGLVCDHIIPINQKGAIWDERNHQSLCKHPCHDRKSGYDQKKYTGPFTELSNGKKIPI